jgi:hypothetical protein
MDCPNAFQNFAAAAIRSGLHAVSARDADLSGPSNVDAASAYAGFDVPFHDIFAGDTAARPMVCHLLVPFFAIQRDVS